MSPRRLVPTLRSLTHALVAEELYRAASTSDLASIMPRLASLPAELCRELLQEVVSARDLPGAVRCEALGLLLQRPMRTGTLTLGTFHQDHNGAVLDVLRGQECNLRVLDLRGVWLRDDVERDGLRCVLRVLPNLATLSMMHGADDAILAEIGRSNGRLKYLDVSGEGSITERGLRALRQASLRTVDLGATSPLDPSQVAVLLEGLPNLNSLGDYPHTGIALQHHRMPTSLLYLHDRDTRLQAMETILHLCPQLNHLHLDQPSPPILNKLQSLSRLKHLKLTRFPCRDLLEALAPLGARLTSLDLVLGRGSVNVSRIAALCPLLRTLNFYKMEYITHLGPDTLPVLEELRVAFSPVSVSCLAYLVSGSPRLRVLELHVGPDFGDATAVDLFVGTPLPHLESIILRDAPSLTALSAQVVMGTCPSLTMLGDLGEWAVTDQDMQDLLRDIREDNIQLYLKNALYDT